MTVLSIVLLAVGWATILYLVVQACRPGINTTELLKSNAVLLAYLELYEGRPRSAYERTFWTKVQAHAVEIALMLEPDEIRDAIVARRQALTNQWKLTSGC